jgi:hypothetical protein
MPTCPFCEGQISSTALKCKHCGEWVRPPAERTGAGGAPPVARRSGYDDPDESLGRAANRYVSFSMVTGGIGLVLFLIIFFTIFVPVMCSDRGGPFRSQPNLPDGITFP